MGWREWSFTHISLVSFCVNMKRRKNAFFLSSKYTPKEVLIRSPADLREEYEDKAAGNDKRRKTRRINGDHKFSIQINHSWGRGIVSTCNGSVYDT